MTQKEKGKYNPKVDASLGPRGTVQAAAADIEPLASSHSEQTNEEQRANHSQNDTGTVRE